MSPGNSQTAVTDMPAIRRRNLLVLCTGNSARSIMAEAIFNHTGKRYFHAYSAGSSPTGQVNPLALAHIDQLGMNGSAFRSKSWQEFTAPDAPEVDIVLTVCDNAAREVCPLLSDDVLHVHWGLSDPASVAGGIEQARKAFELCFEAIKSRVEVLAALPLDLYSTKRIAALMALYAPDNALETQV
jgi:arsenate reductase (thioredoxin)